MSIFNLYRTEANWYLRITLKGIVSVWDNNAGAMAAAPTWDNSVIVLIWSDVINGYPVEIPAALPSGTYELTFYDAAVPAAADPVLYGEDYINRYTHG